MTQEERWLISYNKVMAFIKDNHRNPSKHRIEEHVLINWIKQQRKLMNVGKFKDDRVERFNELLALIEVNKHVNQYM